MHSFLLYMYNGSQVYRASHIVMDCIMVLMDHRCQLQTGHLVSCWFLVTRVSLFSHKCEKDGPFSLLIGPCSTYSLYLILSSLLPSSSLVLFLWSLLNRLQLCPTPPLKRSTLLLAISNMHHLLGMRSKSSSSFHKKTLRHVIYWNGGWAMLRSSLTCQNIQEIYLVHQVCECTCLYKYIQLIAYSRVCCCCWVYILQRKGHNLSTMLSSAAWDNLHTYACEAMP